VNKESILKEFELFSLGTGGIGNWLTRLTHDDVFLRLENINKDPLSKVQLNQLLVLGHEAPLSDGFFNYYWVKAPQEHPYDVRSVKFFEAKWVDSKNILSLDHLKWGLYRLFIDGLLWFGNVRTGYRKLRSLSEEELETFFRLKRLPTEIIKSRGPALPLKQIPKDDRYLISEMACKSYEQNPNGYLKDALLKSYKALSASGHSRVTIKELLDADNLDASYKQRQMELIFSADDVLNEAISSEAEIADKYERIERKFTSSREAALKNTEYYLSMVSDLDVYVATSMRTRQDFRKMADACEKIFSAAQLKDLNLRYFDPTLSAAAGHEDKGLIECLMVKCAKVLIYCSGEKESYGKDAEAAMALSLGKPVIFYCDHEQKSRFYREVHPLSRLIQFETGIAVGAMVTDSLDEVSELLFRIFENKMNYLLERSKNGTLKILEERTKSVVRLQTNYQLLSETFWNHYHNR
jgi:hypothetical protein